MSRTGGPSILYIYYFLFPTKKKRIIYMWSLFSSNFPCTCKIIQSYTRCLVLVFSVPLLHPTARFGRGFFAWDKQIYNEPPFKGSSIIPYPPGNDHISHLGKRKIIFKLALGRDMLVPRRVYIEVLSHAATVTTRISIHVF